MTHIHETAIIRGSVTIGRQVLIEPYAVITGPCIIRDDVYIGAHAVIGAPAQHTGSYPHPIQGQNDPKGVVIERGVCIREFSTVHQGLMQPTTIGNNTLIMTGTHIAHDCKIGIKNTIGSYLVTGGFTFTGDDVTFGQGCVTHPWTCIGTGAMVGLNSSVIRDIEPYAKVAGAPTRLIGHNFRKRDIPAMPSMNSEIWEEYSRMQDARDELRDQWYAR